jgi:cbb3-type cytochrome oxidase cytochrome c subunit
MQALAYAGTPYSDADIAGASLAMQEQGNVIVARLAEAGIEAAWDDEIIALTAYLQRLGTDIPNDDEIADGGEE